MSLTLILTLTAQVRRVRLDVRLRVQAATPLSQLRPPRVLRLRGGVLASKHAPPHVQR